MEAGAGECLEREAGGPHIQTGEGMDVLGALNTDWGAACGRGISLGEH